MTVYVDEPKHRLGRMVMCHMIATTPGELRYMADLIGIDRRHVQHEGTTKEHFDISKGKRQQAVALGAEQVTTRELVRWLHRHST